MQIDCTILILTYKGKHHLALLLPTVQEAIANTPGFSVEVQVVDNGPDDGSKALIEQNYPDFQYLVSPVNDYLFSLNGFVQKASGKYTFILNNDMKLHPDVLNQVLPLLENDPELFGVNCKVLNWDGEGIQSNVRLLEKKRGWMRSYWKQEADDEIRYTLYGGGGSAVFRTEMYNMLEGFDALYRPAYCEDLDLSHRAWHRGWKVVFQPRAVLYHRESATIGQQFGSDELTRKIYKNQILWMIRNGNFSGFAAMFFLLLPYRLLLGWRVDKNSYVALWRALGKMPLAWRKRKQEPEPVIRDEEIVQYLNQVYKCYAVSQ